MNPFQKGDRVQYTGEWGLPQKTGTVISVKGEFVQWHVDGYPYSPDDFHEHSYLELESTSKPCKVLHCCKCNSPNPWAKPNQPDRKTYVCFECR